MNKKITKIEIFFFLLFILLSVCIEKTGKKKINKFIGKWETDNDFVLIFFENGTCRMEGIFNGPGVWEIENDTIFITLRFTGGKNYMSYNYSFSNAGKTLILTDSGDRSWVYNKVE